MANERMTPVRIAVAEDEADLRTAYVRLLERLGHTVVCAVSNGQELLAACSEHEVDLVIADLDMPIIDGLTAAEDLMERGIPVVLVSGHPDAEALVLEHEPVVTRVLKPATLDTLQRAIQQALSTRR